MATFDKERDAIVLRIVYDGPASAGKTTSVRALGESLGRPVVTPEEAGERTLYFDWLEYTGGIFDGHPLRCQVITVPGQSLLARRRRALLASADAVVYVSPVSAEGLPEVVGALDHLQGVLSVTSEEPIGVILQANMRDLPSAAPADAIRDALDRAGLRIGVVETTATLGSGVRQAFVFAVRLALDRVREQMRTGTLVTGRPEIDSPEELHRRMRATELERPYEMAIARPSAPSPIAEIVSGPRSPTAVSTDIPRPPDETVGAGMIWPPIEGRVLLRDATLREVRIARGDGGYSGASDDGWRVHSPSASVFDDLEEGRSALVRWARLHAQHDKTLSSPRCIVLASDGAGRHRLWQIVRTRASLREQLASVLGERDDERVATALAEVALRLMDLAERVEGTKAYIPVTLDTAGVHEDQTVYVGLVPEAAHDTLGVEARVLEELRPIARDFASRPGIARAVARMSEDRARGEGAQRTIGRLLELLRAPT